MHAGTHHGVFPARARLRGITLLELCFALGLLALMAGLAAPGLRASLRAAAVRSASLELLSGLRQIRAASILEARAGAFCPSAYAPGGNCLPSSIAGGAWQSFLELGEAREPVGGRSLPRGVVLRATRSPLRFWPHAHAASTGTLTICDAQDIAAPRAIVISQSGRARLATASPGACGS